MPDLPGLVTRCVCANKTFAELIQAGCKDKEQAVAQFGVASKCQLCAAYLDYALQHQRAEVPVILGDTKAD